MEMEYKWRPLNLIAESFTAAERSGSRKEKHREGFRKIFYGLIRRIE